MGSYWSSFFEKDELDESTGLTVTQKRLLVQTWAPVDKDYKKNGVALFVQLFEEYPETQQLFPKFKDKSIDKIKDSPKLRAHGSIVIKAISTMIQNLDDAECLVEMIKKTGRDHYHRGIDYKYFEIIGQFLLQFLKGQLGTDVITTEAEEAWVTVFKTINSVIKIEMDEEATQSSRPRVNND